MISQHLESCNHCLLICLLVVRYNIVQINPCPTEDTKWDMRQTYWISFIYFYFI